MFLTSIELSADIDDRRLAYVSLHILPPLKGSLPSVIAVQRPPLDAENLLLRSVEWTTLFGGHIQTYNTALEQANVILLYFLGSSVCQLDWGIIHFPQVLEEFRSHNS